MTSEKVVTANGRRGACQTLDVTGRGDLGRSVASSGDAAATARRTVRHHERIDLANPSGHVDVPLAVRAAGFPDGAGRRHVPTPTRLPDPWTFPAFRSGSTAAATASSSP